MLRADQDPSDKPHTLISTTISVQTSVAAIVAAIDDIYSDVVGIDSKDDEDTSKSNGSDLIDTIMNNHRALKQLDNARIQLTKIVEMVGLNIKV